MPINAPTGERPAGLPQDYVDARLQALAKSRKEGKKPDSPYRKAHKAMNPSAREQAHYRVRKIHEEKVAKRGQDIAERWRVKDPNREVSRKEKLARGTARVGETALRTALDEVVVEPIAKIVKARRLQKAMKDDCVAILTVEYANAVLKRGGKPDKEQAKDTAQKISKAQENLQRFAQGLDAQQVRDTVLQNAATTPKGKAFLAEISTILQPLIQGQQTEVANVTKQVENVLRGNEASLAQNLDAKQVAEGLLLTAQEIRSRGMITDEGKAADTFLFGEDNPYANRKKSWGDTLFGAEEDASKSLRVLAIGDYLAPVIQTGRPIFFGAVGLGLAAAPVPTLAVVGGTLLITHLHKLQIDRAMRRIDKAQGLGNIRDHQTTEDRSLLQKLMTGAGDAMNVNWEKSGKALAVDYGIAIGSRVGLGVAANAGAFFLGHVGNWIAHRGNGGAVENASQHVAPKSNDITSVTISPKPKTNRILNLLSFFGKKKDVGHPSINDSSIGDKVRSAIDSAQHPKADHALPVPHPSHPPLGDNKFTTGDTTASAIQRPNPSHPPLGDNKFTTGDTTASATQRPTESALYARVARGDMEQAASQGGNVISEAGSTVQSILNRDLHGAGMHLDQAVLDVGRGTLDVLGGIKDAGSSVGSFVDEQREHIFQQGGKPVQPMESALKPLTPAELTKLHNDVKLPSGAHWGKGSLADNIYSNSNGPDGATNLIATDIHTVSVAGQLHLDGNLVSGGKTIGTFDVLENKLAAPEGFGKFLTEHSITSKDYSIHLFPNLPDPDHAPYLNDYVIPGRPGIHFEGTDYWGEQANGLHATINGHEVFIEFPKGKGVDIVHGDKTMLNVWTKDAKGELHLGHMTSDDAARLLNVKTQGWAESSDIENQSAFDANIQLVQINQTGNHLDIGLIATGQGHARVDTNFTFGGGLKAGFDLTGKLNPENALHAPVPVQDIINWRQDPRGAALFAAAGVAGFAAGYFIHKGINKVRGGAPTAAAVATTGGNTGTGGTGRNLPPKSPGNPGGGSVGPQVPPASIVLAAPARQSVYNAAYNPARGRRRNEQLDAVVENLNLAPTTPPATPDQLREQAKSILAAAAKGRQSADIPSSAQAALSALPPALQSQMTDKKNAEVLAIAMAKDHADETKVGLIRDQLQRAANVQAGINAYINDPIAAANGAPRTSSGKVAAAVAAVRENEPTLPAGAAAGSVSPAIALREVDMLLQNHELRNHTADIINALEAAGYTPSVLAVVAARLYDPKPSRDMNVLAKERVEEAYKAAGIDLTNPKVDTDEVVMIGHTLNNIFRNDNTLGNDAMRLGAILAVTQHGTPLPLRVRMVAELVVASTQERLDSAHNYFTYNKPATGLTPTEHQQIIIELKKAGLPEKEVEKKFGSVTLGKVDEAVRKATEAGPDSRADQLFEGLKLLESDPAKNPGFASQVGDVILQVKAQLVANGGDLSDVDIQEAVGKLTTERNLKPDRRAIIARDVLQRLTHDGADQVKPEIIRTVIAAAGLKKIASGTSLDNATTQTMLHLGLEILKYNENGGPGKAQPTNELDDFSKHLSDELDLEDGHRIALAEVVIKNNDGLSPVMSPEHRLNQVLQIAVSPNASAEQINRVMKAVYEYPNWNKTKIEAADLQGLIGTIKDLEKQAVIYGRLVKVSAGNAIAQVAIDRLLSHSAGATTPADAKNVVSVVMGLQRAEQDNEEILEAMTVAQAGGLALDRAKVMKEAQRRGKLANLDTQELAELIVIAAAPDPKEFDQIKSVYISVQGVTSNPTEVSKAMDLLQIKKDKREEFVAKYLKGVQNTITLYTPTPYPSPISPRDRAAIDQANAAARDAAIRSLAPKLRAALAMVGSLDLSGIDQGDMVTKITSELGTPTSPTGATIAAVDSSVVTGAWDVVTSSTT